MAKLSKIQRVTDYMNKYPSKSAKQIIASLSRYGVTPSDVANARNRKKRRPGVAVARRPMNGEAPKVNPPEAVVSAIRLMVASGNNMATAIGFLQATSHHHMEKYLKSK